MAVLRKASDVKRISQVVNALFKNGLGYFVEEMELKFHLPFFQKLMKHKFKPPVRPEERLRKVFEELGGTYIKLGQLLSIRPDLVGMEYCEECQKLQDQVPPFPFAKAREIVEAELKKPLDQLFKHFSETPIASASIGQVYEARLKNGTRVAVKVQRPNIREQMEADIDILSYFARKMERHTRFKKHRPTLIVEEFKRYTENELSYLKEARNADRFYHNFEGYKSVKIPKVFWSHTTQKVLTLEYIDGVKINDLIKSHHHFDKKWLIREGLAAEFKQIFDDGFFHADLHPGNILLLKNKVIAFLDFGIVGSITPGLKREGIRLFMSIMEGDSGAVADTLLRVGTASNDTDKDSFRREVDAIVGEWYGTNISQIRVTHMLHKLFSSCATNAIKLPADIVLLGKALVTIEGTCRLIEPEFDLIRNSKPYFRKMMARQSEIKMEQLSQYYKRFKRAFVDLPDSAATLLDKIKEPRIKVDIEDTDINKLGLEIDRSSNRLAYGILIAALILAGALMAQLSTGPRVLGISIFSLICFIIATILGGILLYSVLKEGH